MHNNSSLCAANHAKKRNAAKGSSSTTAADMTCSCVTHLSAERRIVSLAHPLRQLVAQPNRRVLPDGLGEEELRQPGRVRLHPLRPEHFARLSALNTRERARVCMRVYVRVRNGGRTKTQQEPSQKGAPQPECTAPWLRCEARKFQACARAGLLR